MSLENNESYIIRAEELELLLAGAHVSSWYGISILKSGSREKITRERANAILAGLYQKEYISWEGDDILVLEPVRSFIEILGNAGQCVRVDRKDSEAPVMLAYLWKDRCAVVEQSLWDDQAYRFRLAEKEEFRTYIESNKTEWKSVETIRIDKPNQ